MDLISRVCLEGMKKILLRTCLHLNLCGFCASLLNDLKKTLYDQCTQTSSQYHPAHKIFLFSDTAVLHAINDNTLFMSLPQYLILFELFQCFVLFPTCSAVNHFTPFQLQIE